MSAGVPAVSGWKVTDGASLSSNLTEEADVIVIGTGAGGGTTAEILARSGLSVILAEEGRQPPTESPEMLLS